MKKLLIIFLYFVASWIFYSSVVLAEECTPNCGSPEECESRINECEKLLTMSVNATKPHEQKVKEMETNIAAIDANVQSLLKQIEIKKANIAKNSEKLTLRQQLLETQVRDFYKKDYQTDIEYVVTGLLGGGSVSDTLQVLGYRQSLINQEKKLIASLVVEITNLNKAKVQLEDSQKWLASKRVSLEIVLAPIRKLVEGAKAYQSKLNQTVGSLSARQQQLIAEKIGSLNLSRSADISMACADDRDVDPGFSPRFAFYTFGIPHRVGMSQFGAYGRAKAGQNYREILNAYYNNVNIEKRDNIDIKVDGFGSMKLEQYMLGIYEIPDSWPMETLKAQAIAARSYALSYTNNGANSICTTQSCQVYKGGNKGGNWEQAVKQTEGEVLISGGQVVKAWFSSTDGGYTHTSAEVFGGSTPFTKNLRDASGDINSLSDLFSKAYDRESPCFYNAQGWRNEYNKTAWLKSEEVADIVNVILVSSKTNSWDSWSADRVKQELGGDAFSRIDSVSMNFDLGSGRTTSVTVSGDRGSKTFDAKTFKDYFNVRAPANIAIVGPLFNIEKR